MSSQTKAHLTATSLLLVVLCLFPAETLDFPVAFTVVRNLDPPLGIDVFLNQTGCCQKDGFGNPSGYNVVSLDGFKSASTPATVQNGVSPLSFWANAFSQIAALKTGKGGSTTASLQQYLLDTYHDNGMTLLMNVFADEAPISQGNADPNATAQSIIDMVKSTQLDGVSVEFQDFQAVAAGNASLWLSTFLSTLRSGLAGKQVVLIIPVTIVNRVQLFQQTIISSLVDLFVLKYYGFSSQTYLNYNSLFNTSTVYPQTALAELLRSQTVAIDLCRTVIAKPASPIINGFVGSMQLGTAFANAQNALGWFGGYANLDFESDVSGSFQLQVLRQIRNSCRSNFCFCL